MREWEPGKTSQLMREWEPGKTSSPNTRILKQLALHTPLTIHVINSKSEAPRASLSWFDVTPVLPVESRNWTDHLTEKAERRKWTDRLQMFLFLMTHQNQVLYLTKKGFSPAEFGTDRLRSKKQRFACLLCDRAWPDRMYPRRSDRKQGLTRKRKLRSFRADARRETVTVTHSASRRSIYSRRSLSHDKLLCREP